MKTTEELIEEFLANGGQIEKLPAIEVDIKKVISSTSKKTPDLMTLHEAEIMFGEKQAKCKKEKVTDYSSINFSLIPEHLHKLIKKNKHEDEQSNNKGVAKNETD